jgi:hypothetical protein
VVPLVATLAQIKEFFKTDDVSLPEPLPLLSRLATFYFETVRGYEAKPINQTWMVEVKALRDLNELMAPSSRSVGEAQHVNSNHSSKKNHKTSSSSRTGVYELAGENFRAGGNPNLHAENVCLNFRSSVALLLTLVSRANF